MKALILSIIIAVFLFHPWPCKAQDDEIIARKTTTILARFLTAEDPVNFAKAHGIELNNGMIEIVMYVDKNFSLDTLTAKYDLKNSKKRENIITAEVSINNLKGLCKEPSVIFIRPPAKLVEMR